ASGSSYVFTLQATVPAQTAVGVSDLIAVAASSVTIPTSVPSLHLRVTSGAIDFSTTVQLSSYLQNVVPDATISYMMNFSNTGTLTAQNVVLTNTLPSGAIYAGVIYAGCYSCDGFSGTPIAVNGNVVSFNLGSMLPAVYSSNGIIIMLAHLDPSL